ncbi:MAG TPA: glycosyltransferase family 4 protein [Povalibacter sp.]
MPDPRNSRPTIIHLVHERIGAVGGIQRFDLRTVRALAEIAAERQWDLQVISFDGVTPGVDLPPQVQFRSANGRRWRLLSMLAGVCLRRNVKEIFIGHLRLAKMSWPVLAAFPRTRRLLFVHGIEAWHPGRSRIYRFASRTVVNRFIDDVISVSRFTVKRMHAAMQTQGPRLHLLPNALDVDETILAAPRGSSAGDGPALLSVARMDRHDMPKGIPAALRAVATLTREFPQLRYRIVGDGELRKTHEALAQQLGIASHVQFLGRISDVQLTAVYAASDIFLLPSTKEGFGIVFLEAWFAGLPIVCGNIDASAEVVENGVDGFAVPPDDPAVIAAAVATLLKDQQLAEQFVINGRQKLLARYSHIRFIEKLRAIASNTHQTIEHPASGIGGLEDPT